MDCRDHILLIDLHLVSATLATGRPPLDCKEEQRGGEGLHYFMDKKRAPGMNPALFTPTIPIAMDCVL